MALLSARLDSRLADLRGVSRIHGQGTFACLSIDTDVEPSFFSSMYVTVVAWVFMLTNSLRVLTYLPMIRKLLRPGIAAECQSQLTWLLWATANLSMSLHLFELAGRELNDAVALTGANTLMCCVCWHLVRRAQRRALQASSEGVISPGPATLSASQPAPGTRSSAGERQVARLAGDHPSNQRADVAVPG